MTKVWRPATTGVGLILIVILTSTSAYAGGPGKWTVITDKQGRNIDEVDVARTDAGVLNVAWHRSEQDNSFIKVTGISTAGAKLSTTTVLEGWDSTVNPTLVRDGDGLRVFFSGLGGPAPYESNGAMYTATAPASGTPWTLADGSLSQANSAYATNIAGGTIAGGVPWAIWASTGGLRVHEGLDSSVPAAEADISLEEECCSYNTVLATDTETQEVWAAWSAIYDNTAWWVQRVSPSVDERVRAPGQGKDSIPALTRTGLEARRGGGVYLGYCTGYPTCKKVQLWNVGGGGRLTKKAAGARMVTVAAGKGGTMWVLWEDDDRILAVRTNRQVTKFTKSYSIKPPAKTSSIWSLQAEGTGKNLDVLATVTKGGGIATWHTQIK